MESWAAFAAQFFGCPVRTCPLPLFSVLPWRACTLAVSMLAVTTQEAKNMDDVRISIEMRIEARSEFSARRYAEKCGLSVSDGKWYPHRDTNGGKLYISSSAPCQGIAQALAADASLCGGRASQSDFCANPGSDAVHCEDRLPAVAVQMR